MDLSESQVEGLSPDAASIKAGRKLAAARHWKDLGHDARALWGQCQGSKLYQTRVDRSDMTTSCSCPSRKFPCKHALGLLFLAAAAPAEVPEAEAPEWVSDWLERRGVRAERAAQRKADKAEEAADPAAQAKRAQKRHDNILAGLDRLDEWMCDVVRQGLARLEVEGVTPWEQNARRLVDAQAPGLAGRVRGLGEQVGAGPGWAARVLEGMGSLALLTRAYRRLDALDAPLAHDVRQLVGLSLDKDEVERVGERVADRWLTLGQTLDSEAQLRVQRTWLRGVQSGRYALVLQFAAAGAPFGERFAPGSVFEAELCYWPSAAPLRALVASRTGTPEPLGAPAGGESIEALLERAAGAFGALPWLERLPTLLSGVRALWRDGRALLCDADGRALPAARGDHRALFAISGGHPVQVAAVWDGAELQLLGVFADGAFSSLAGGSDADAAA
jgi:hypothetical protein